MNTKFTKGSIRYSLIVSLRGRNEPPDLGTSVPYDPWATRTARSKDKQLSGLIDYKPAKPSNIGGRAVRLPGSGKPSKLMYRKRDGLPRNPEDRAAAIERHRAQARERMRRIRKAQLNYR